MYTVKFKSEKIKLWKCPECGRQFQRKGQSHSCKYYPLEQHFAGKEKGEALFTLLKKVLKKNVGPFKIESLSCCIHFVSITTFLAVKIFRNKIRIDFTLDHKINSRRPYQFLQISANRYLYYIEVTKEEQLDDELMEWIQMAYDKDLKPNKHPTSHP